MEKKNLTTKQRQTRYRLIQYSSFGGSFITLFAPYITLGAINADTWFTTESGWKVGLGGSLALALMGIATMLVSKKKEDTTITNGWITMIVGWFAVAFIFGLLSDIIDQISMIMMYGGLGLLGTFGLDMVSKKYKAKADEIKTLTKEVKKEQLKEEIKQESHVAVE